MKRPEKEAVVAQLTEEFRNADAVYLTEYRGLTVPQISDLREKLGRDTSYTVAKNTLARIAAKEAGIEGLDEILSGPTAITFVKGDFIEAAKVIRDFAKDNKALVIKGAAADGTVYDAEGAKKLADLKSRPQLLAEFAGDIKHRWPRPRTCSTLCLPSCAHDRRPARKAGEGCLIYALTA